MIYVHCITTENVSFFLYNSVGCSPCSGVKKFSGLLLLLFLVASLRSDQQNE